MFTVWRMLPGLFICLYLLESPIRSPPTKNGENIWSPSTEPHADGTSHPEASLSGLGITKLPNLFGPPSLPAPMERPRPTAAAHPCPVGVLCSPGISVQPKQVNVRNEPQMYWASTESVVNRLERTVVDRCQSP